jgi:hypothetical protein
MYSSVSRSQKKGYHNNLSVCELVSTNLLLSQINLYTKIYIKSDNSLNNNTEN